MLTLSRMNESLTSRLYEQKMKRDFPPSELKSLSAILNMMRKGAYDVFGAYEGDELTAYALLYRPSGVRAALLDYLAVEPEIRGHGVGTQLLTRLREHYAESADVLLIECERPISAPDEAQARKRIRFYQQAGAQMTSVRIWLFDVEYSILVLPCRHSALQRDWAKEMLSIYAEMLPSELYEKNVRLIRE